MVHFDGYILNYSIIVAAEVPSYGTAAAANKGHP